MKIPDYLNISNEDNMKLMARYSDNHFDLAIVDPPYGIDFAKTHTGNGWVVRDSKDWDKNRPNKEYFDELFRVSKNQIIWGGNYMTEYLPPSQGWLFWDKGQRNFSLADGELAFTSFDKAMRVFEMSRGKIQGLQRGVKKFHPTQKPIELYTYQIQKYAKPNDKILDTHLGSGSIAIAIDQANKIEGMNLTLTACELDKEYYDKSLERISTQCDWQPLLKVERKEPIQTSLL